MIQFNAADLVWLLPEIILFVTASAVVLLSVIVRPEARSGLAALAVIGALAAGWAAYGLSDGNVELFSRMVIVDPFATYFRYLFVLAVLGVFSFPSGRSRRREGTGPNTTGSCSSPRSG